jgi:seryl-tRNA synthetase
MPVRSIMTASVKDLHAEHAELTDRLNKVTRQRDQLDAEIQTLLAKRQLVEELTVRIEHYQAGTTPIEVERARAASIPL